jgi:hypothetical protein
MTNRDVWILIEVACRDIKRIYRRKSGKSQKTIKN